MKLQVMKCLAVSAPRRQMLEGRRWSLGEGSRKWQWQV